ncbi:MAG: hypothetical protein Q4D89_02345 [Arachnia propionica]|nr:hypothetical protein [Arachnia propionica]
MNEHHPPGMQPAQQPQPGQVPYGHAQYGGPPPQGHWQMTPPVKPQRPGGATGAGVLGIISGSLGLIKAILLIITTAVLQSGEVIVNLKNPELVIALTNINGYGTLVAAVALLVSGITFLKGKGHGVLLAAACAQAALVILSLVIEITADTLANPSVVLGLIIGAGLAGTTIFLLLSPDVQRWKK